MTPNVRPRFGVGGDMRPPLIVVMSPETTANCLGRHVVACKPSHVYSLSPRARSYATKIAE